MQIYGKKGFLTLLYVRTVQPLENVISCDVLV
jgi:hypothetical protein